MDLRFSLIPAIGLLLGLVALVLARPAPGYHLWQMLDFP
jgi:hypothetical protein